MCSITRVHYKFSPGTTLEPEVRERKLGSGRNMFIPAGSTKIVKVRVEGDLSGEGFVESKQPEEQNV